MIRRAAPKEFLLISQSEHARFSGFLAEHLGNESFAPPSPREEVISAIAAHDAGWPLHDDAPTLNPHGLPLHVFEIPISLATRVWSASADSAVARGPYTALLVSLHQMALSGVARPAQTAGPIGAARSPRDQFDLNKFQHQQIERQDTLRKQLGFHTDIPLLLGLAEPGTNEVEDQLRFNFRLLQLCDRLSLQLCCGKALFPMIDEVIPHPGDPPITLRTRWLDDLTNAIDPWPFDEPQLSARIPCRRVSAEPFASEEEFRSVYHAAPVEVLRVELHAFS